MEHINYSFIEWKIGGAWASFTSSGIMRFTWMTIEHYKEKTCFLSLTALRGFYSNILRGFKKQMIYQVSIRYHFSDDLTEERKERYMKVINEYMEKYGILAQEA